MKIFSKETYTISPLDTQTCWESKKNLWLSSDLNCKLKVELFDFDLSKLHQTILNKLESFIQEYCKKGGRFNSAETKQEGI